MVEAKNLEELQMVVHCDHSNDKKRKKTAILNKFTTFCNTLKKSAIHAKSTSGYETRFLGNHDYGYEHHIDQCDSDDNAIIYEEEEDNGYGYYDYSAERGASDFMAQMQAASEARRPAVYFDYDDFLDAHYEQQYF